jgi:TolB-like protein/Tfp pilus assembly protein PilF
MTDSASPVVRLFRELRRRRVFRTAGLYIVGAWLVIQVADVLFPGWGLPDAAINVLLIAAILGFPLALVFGWFYDITTRGIVRTQPDAEGGGADAIRLRRGDYLILSALAVVAAVIVYDAVRDIADAPVLATADGGGPDALQPLEKLDNSIAVLPFANISNDPDNDVFCAGISEEILNKLGAFSELTVIARTSSFAFKGSDYGIRQISDVLGVRYLLQGSVRKQGDRLRISAQLVDHQGVQKWSDTFDRTLANVFAIQSEIADLVATTIAPQVVPRPVESRAPDLDAYELFLAGRESLHRRDTRVATELLEEAIERDPDFAEAHAEYAIAILIGSPDADTVAAANRAIDTALALQPGLLRARAARGLALGQQFEPDYAASVPILRDVLNKDPNMVDAMNWLGNALRAQGEDDEADQWLERAYRLDPLHGAIAANMANYHVKRGEMRRAEQILERLVHLPQPRKYGFIGLRDFYRNTGQLAKLNAIEKRFALTGTHHYYGLALSYACIGSMETAEYWIERSIRDLPDFVWITMFPLLVPHWRGEYREALSALEQSLAERNVDLEKEQPVFTWFLGSAHALAGDYSGAIALLRPQFEGRPATNDEWELDARLALAWAYLETGADAEATALLEELESVYATERAAGTEPGNPHLYFYAQNAALLGETELALDRLERAIELGWREAIINRHDPRMASLWDNPRYQTLIAWVESDVARQRAEIEAMDAEEDFVALLDQVRAASLGAGGN